MWLVVVEAGVVEDEVDEPLADHVLAQDCPDPEFPLLVGLDAGVQLV